MTSTNPSKQPIPSMGPIEEDDEFEEFTTEDWTPDQQDKSDITQWDDNWDDDNLDDEFSRQLRAELEKHQQQQQPK